MKGLLEDFATKLDAIYGDAPEALYKTIGDSTKDLINGGTWSLYEVVDKTAYHYVITLGSKCQCCNPTQTKQAFFIDKDGNTLGSTDEYPKFELKKILRFKNYVNPYAIKISL